MNGDIHITDTEWWNDLLHGIYGPRKGGARIIVDAEDARTGVGKTGLAVFLARLLCRVFDYDLQEDDLTLSGEHYLQRWREHPGKEQPSVLILDELAGAGAGHSRRSMATQNVELGNAWQLMRKKRIVSIVTLPHWSKADKEMRTQADFRLWCLSRPIGFFKPFQVGTGFDDADATTYGYDDVGRIGFPDLNTHDDEYYRLITEKKDELLQSEFFDADKMHGEEAEEDAEPEEVDRETRREVAQRMRNEGFSGQKIAQAVSRSDTWVYNNTEDPMEVET